MCVYVSPLLCRSDTSVMKALNLEGNIDQKGPAADSTFAFNELFL